MNFLFLLPFIFFCELGNTQVINQSTQQSQKIEQKVPKKTSVEIQAIQTRTFETTEKKLFRATLKVLQNNSYKDKHTYTYAYKYRYTYILYIYI